ncbi:hypothetical protein HK098_004350 [Nowakowskiella sp. JEL0407]|nr:hypothetical protein HK098_004350 [Nowakowskiella sp. JEL0407]
MADEYDVFESSLGIFGDSPFAHGNPGQNVSYYRMKNADNSSPIPNTIEFELADVDATAVNLMAHYAWNSAYILADLIEKGEINVTSKRVLELGAGAGIPGILAFLNNANHVVLSDYPAQEIMDTLQRNADSAKRFSKNTESSISVVGHIWGDQSTLSNVMTKINSQKFDLIFLADTLWLSEQHSALLKTISQVLTQDGEVHLVCGNHTGVYTIKRFLEKASSVSFVNENGHESELLLTMSSRRVFSWAANWSEVDGYGVELEFKEDADEFEDDVDSNMSERKRRVYYYVLKFK